MAKVITIDPEQWGRILDQWIDDPSDIALHDWLRQQFMVELIDGPDQTSSIPDRYYLRCDTDQAALMFLLKHA